MRVKLTKLYYPKLQRRKTHKRECVPKRLHLCCAINRNLNLGRLLATEEEIFSDAFKIFMHFLEETSASSI